MTKINPPHSPKGPTAIPKSPPKQRPRVGTPPTPGDVATEQQLKTPSERDESVSMTSDVPDPMIAQAAIDVAEGRQDTSRAQESNRTYKKMKPD